MNTMTLIGTGLAVGLALGGCSSYHTGKHGTAVRAKAVIAGPGITGEARLSEEYEGRVRIKLKLEGSPESKLTPGLHAIHIHETGNCEPFSAAKGHYDGNIDPQVNPEANVSPAWEIIPTISAICQICPLTRPKKALSILLRTGSRSLPD